MKWASPSLPRLRLRVHERQICCLLPAILCLANINPGILRAPTAPFVRASVPCSVLRHPPTTIPQYVCMHRALKRHPLLSKPVVRAPLTFACTTHAYYERPVHLCVCLVCRLRRVLAWTLLSPNQCCGLLLPRRFPCESAARSCKPTAPAERISWPAQDNYGEERICTP